MTLRILAYTIAIWVVFTIAGTLNALLGRAVISPGLGEYGVHICDILRLLALVVFVTYIFIRSLKIRQYTKSDLLFIGLLWVALTVVYEFIYKHYFVRLPWIRVFADYNILKGRIKVSVLIAEFLAPYLFGTRRLSKRRRRHQSAS